MVEVEHFLRDRLDARFVVPGADGAWSSTPTSEECFRTSLQDATSNQTTPFGADFMKISFDKRKRGKLAISDDVEPLNACILCYLAQLELPEMRRRAYATDEIPHPWPTSSQPWRSVGENVSRHGGRSVKRRWSPR